MIFVSPLFRDRSSMYLKTTKRVVLDSLRGFTIKINMFKALSIPTLIIRR